MKLFDITNFNKGEFAIEFEIYHEYDKIISNILFKFFVDIPEYEEGLCLYVKDGELRTNPPSHMPQYFARTFLFIMDDFLYRVYDSVIELKHLVRKEDATLTLKTTRYFKFEELALHETYNYVYCELKKQHLVYYKKDQTMRIYGDPLPNQTYAHRIYGFLYWLYHKGYVAKIYWR